MGTSVSLQPRMLFDPVSQAGEPAVDSRLVSLGAAIAPAHYARQEHPIAGLHADQRPARVPLHGRKPLH